MNTRPLPPHRTSKVLPKHGGVVVHFQHRATMRRAVRNRATLPSGVPATTLPVDSSGCMSSGTWGPPTVSCPMDGNDTYGDCGYAMCDHVDGLRSFGCGQPGFAEIACDLSKLEQQYLADSGGDNGSDEPMLVGPGGAWMTGIAGDPTAVVVDHLDIDFTNEALMQYCIDWFFGVCMAWSVPDDVISNFTPGCSFLSADTPNPSNGHYTAVATVDANGSYYVWTWGSYFVASQAFIASVAPSGFVTFSALQFSKATGLDARGRHVGDVAAAWVAMGGNASLVAPVVLMFPPKGTPTLPSSRLVPAS